MSQSPARVKIERERSLGVVWRRIYGPGFWVTFRTGWLLIRTVGNEQHDSGFLPRGQRVFFHPSMVGPYELRDEDQNFIDAMMIGGADARN